MDRHAHDGQSHESVVPCTSFKTRAHVTEPMTDHRRCNGPSSGSGCVLNENTRPAPGGGNLKNSQTLQTPPLHFTHFLPFFLPFPSLLNILIPTSLMYQLITSPISQIPKIYPLLVGVCCCGSFLANQAPSLLVFLKFSGMCL